MKRTDRTRTPGFATRWFSLGLRAPFEFFKLLEIAIEHANDGIAIMKFTGDAAVPIRIVYANAAIERFSGFSREELLDPSNPFLRAQPQNRAQYDELLAQVRAGKPVHFEIELTGRDRATWAEIRWSPLRYRRREVTHYLAIVRDITMRRKAESDRDLLHRSIEQARDGLCILELPDGDVGRRFVTYANNAICDIMKVSREEIMRNGLADLVFAGAPELLDECLATLTSGQILDRDFLAMRGDGTRRWIHVTASPVRGSSGQLERIAVTYRDIDDRKRSDEQLALFQSLLSQTSDFILAADGTRPSQGGPRITYANQAFVALAGLRFQRVTGRSLLEIFSEHNERQVLDNVVLRLERHQRISHELQVRNAKTGADIWIELSGHYVRDEAGRTGSWIFIGNDIRARRQSYVQIAQLMTALDVAEQPIVIYDVLRPLELQLQHRNERAAELGEPLLEAMLNARHHRERIKRAWPALERGFSVRGLVRVTDRYPTDPRWVTLELRPVRWAKGPISSLIAIQHEPRPGEPDLAGGATAPFAALAREIAGYPSRGARRDAFFEVLREEWGAQASLTRTHAAPSARLRASERTGTAVIPAGVFFNRAAAARISWPAALPSHRLTALRTFVETIGH